MSLITALIHFTVSYVVLQRWEGRLGLHPYARSERDWMERSFILLLMLTGTIYTGRSSQPGAYTIGTVC